MVHLNRFAVKKFEFLERMCDLTLFAADCIFHLQFANGKYLQFANGKCLQMENVFSICKLQDATCVHSKNSAHFKF
jgi:hypothetical protein